MVWRAAQGLPAHTGPAAIITTRGVLRFGADGEAVLESVHPGVSVEDVLGNTGWTLRVASDLAETPAPAAQGARGHPRNRSAGFLDSHMNAETHSRETIDLRTEGRTAWITLDRPPLNILDTAMMKSLSRMLAHVLDPKAASCDFLIFQGAGKAFSSGAEIADHTPDRIGAMLAAFSSSVSGNLRAPNA